MAHIKLKKRGLLNKPRKPRGSSGGCSRNCLWLGFFCGLIVIWTAIVVWAVKWTEDEYENNPSQQKSSSLRANQDPQRALQPPQGINYNNNQDAAMAPLKPPPPLNNFNNGPPPQIYNFDNGAPPVIGKRTVINVDDRATEVVYALPPGVNANNADENIRGMALLLHGCSHSALKFFSPSPDCENCIGLSEELRIARILLAQGTMGVVAVTSQDRSSGCWNANADLPHIQDVLNQYQNLIPTTTVGKVLAFGASSGGRFAAQLAARQMVDAAFVGVMSVGGEDNVIPKWEALPQKPPIYLAPMPKDPGTLKACQNDFNAMNFNGPVVLDDKTCAAFPVDATYLNHRVPHMKLDKATMIITALQASGHMDDFGMLIKDPTQSDWRKVLQNQCGASGCLQDQPLGPGVSPLAKALHRAWAFHEYCSEATVKALQFFQQELGGKPFVTFTSTAI